MLWIPKLVAGYRFEGDVVDWSGRGNNGTNQGTSDADGLFGRCRSWDTVPDDYISLTQNYKLPIYAEGQYSIALWFNLPDTTGNETLFAEAKSDTAVQFFIFRVNGNKVQLYIRNDASTFLLDVLSIGTWSSGTWVFVVWTEDSSANVGKLYINGIEDSANFNYTRSGTLTFDTSTIGAVNSNSVISGELNGGKVDRPLLFNKVLTQSEIQSLMLGFTPKGM